MHTELPHDTPVQGLVQRRWRGVTVTDVASGLFAVSALVLIGLRQPSEVLNDFWYHAAFGQWMADHVQLPLWDEISFQPFGRPHLYPPLLHALYAVAAWCAGTPEATFTVVRLLLIGLTLAASWWSARRLIGPSAALLVLLAVALDRITLIVGWSLMPSAIIALLLPLIALALERHRPVLAGVLLLLIGLSHPALPSVVLAGVALAVLALPNLRRQLLTALAIGVVPTLFFGARFAWYFPQLAVASGPEITENDVVGIGHFAYASHYAVSLVILPLVVVGVTTLLLPQVRRAGVLMGLTVAFGAILVTFPELLARGGVLAGLLPDGGSWSGAAHTTRVGSAILVMAASTFLSAAVWRVAPIASRSWAAVASAVFTLSLVAGGGIVFARELLSLSTMQLSVLSGLTLLAALTLVITLSHWIQHRPHPKQPHAWQVILLCFTITFLATVILYGGRATWHIMPILALLAVSQINEKLTEAGGLWRTVVASMNVGLASYKERYGSLASLLLPLQVLGLAVLVPLASSVSLPFSVLTASGDRTLTLQPAFFLQREDPASPEFHRLQEVPELVAFVRRYAPPGVVVHTNSAETGYMLSVLTGASCDNGMLWETKTRGLDASIEAQRALGQGVYIYVNTRPPSVMDDATVNGSIGPWYYAVRQ